MRRDKISRLTEEKDKLKRTNMELGEKLQTSINKYETLKENLQVSLLIKYCFQHQKNK